MLGIIANKIQSTDDTVTDQDKLYILDGISNEACKIYDSISILRQAFLVPVISYEEVNPQNDKIDKHLKELDEVEERLSNYFTKLNTDKQIFETVSF